MSKTETRLKRLEISVAILAVALVALVAYSIYSPIASSLKPLPVGQRLIGIDTPFSQSQLSVINNGSNNNYEIAGEKLLNLTIAGESYINGSYQGPLFEVSLLQAVPVNSLIINSKPSVVYIGATSCIYCGENRWAMALALSRFGSFQTLYNGYSSLGDGDVPTIFWTIENTTTTGAVTFGNGYQSNYINFFSAEYDSPITGGFKFPASQNPITYFVANTTNQSYHTAIQFMSNTNLFQGTPFTLWGQYLNRGADAVVFGNSTAVSTTTNYPPLSYMSHQQILNQLKSFNTTFAYEEYAAADVYIAETCPSINNAAPICSLPAIKTIESKLV